MAASIEDGHKKLGVFSLAFIGLSAMLGSGWLLASYFVFQQAGTYSLISWCLGFAMIITIALSFAETCSIIHHDGATVILPRISHGFYLSAVFGFFGLISWIALIPIEITATLQYLSYFMKGLYINAGELSHEGFWVAIGLAVAISLINSFAMTWIKKLNNYVFTPLKIGIPALVIGYGLYHAGTSHDVVVSHFHSFKGIFLAIPLGVVFSFNAFKTVCVVTGRVDNPHRTIIRALLLSVTICLFIYMGLQMAFDFNATSMVLSHSHSPYAAVLQDSAFMILVLYIGAISSPFTANVFNLHAGNACLYRMSMLDYVPKFFSKMNRYHQYILANLFNVIVALILLSRGSAWSKMVNELTCIMVITYAAAPIALVAFRRNLPDIDFVFKLKCGNLIGFLGFVFCNFMIYWCGYDAILLSIEVLAAVTIYIVLYQAVWAKHHRLDWLRSLWLYAWLGLITLISHYSVFGGTGAIGHSLALILLVVLSVVIYWSIAKTCLPSKQAHDNFNQLCSN